MRASSGQELALFVYLDMAKFNKKHPLIKIFEEFFDAFAAMSEKNCNFAARFR